MPLNIEKNISNCPVSGLKRKAKHLSFKQDDESFSVEHKIQVRYFNADGTPVVGTSRFNPYPVTLTADNETKVNAQTGVIVDKDQEGYDTAIGQEEFLIWATDNGVSIRSLLEVSIATGDSRKKFDI
ncbi:MAG: hypothetical protein A3F72_02885 [Bacteroidetes bacterium RIFCSPLOWO2_12_FULL_35_15]|nr:MAG: hypothetical protein A3F72_02885 [Bacteroidetes bacterium RIFCSPLOWO2_12_FULL_35_15]